MGTNTIVWLAYIAIGTATLSACSAAPSTLPDTQEPVSISTRSHASSQAENPSAEFLLLRLADLIKQSRSAQDLTPDRVAAVMQRPVRFFAPDHFGYGGTLTPEWGYAFEVRGINAPNPRLDLDFIDTSPERSAAATDICRVDFDQFVSALVQDGFTRTTIFGEHGIVVYDRFDRPDLSIKVSSIGEASLPPEKPRRSCVQLVTVQ